jgi:hypothetical protein
LRAFSQDQQPQPDDLSTQAPVVKTAFIPYETPVDALNTANEAFDPPATDVRYNLLIDIEKYYSKTAMTPSIAKEYINSSNNATITIAGVSITSGFGLIRALDMEQNTGGNSTVYTWAHVQIEVSSEEKGWKKQIRNMGLNQLIAGKLYHCLDGSGYPVTDPVRLNEDGTQMAANTPQNQTYYVSKDVKPLKDWSSLSLPASW